MKRRSLPMGETAFLFGTLLSAFGIAMQTKADLGLSMVAAPAYLISLKVPWITFGMGEWFVQGFLFILCCLWTKRFQIKNLWSFIVAVPYGCVLDQVISVFDEIRPVLLWERLSIFLIGSVGLAAGIALFFRSYLPCQVYEMFVKCIAQYTGCTDSKVKLIYDWSSLAIAVFLSILFFHRLAGIGIGTVLCTIINAPLIRLFGKCFDRIFDFRPAVPWLMKYFH